MSYSVQRSITILESQTQTLKVGFTGRTDLLVNISGRRQKLHLAAFDGKETIFFVTSYQPFTPRQIQISLATIAVIVNLVVVMAPEIYLLSLETCKLFIIFSIQRGGI